MTSPYRFLVVLAAVVSMAIAAGCQQGGDDDNTGGGTGGGDGGSPGIGGGGGGPGGLGGFPSGPGGGGDGGGGPGGGGEGGDGGDGGGPGGGGDGGDGGGPGGGGDGGDGGDGPPPECGDELLELGGACDAEADCCDDGLVCIPEVAGESMGRCRSVCDAHSDPDGCAARELCVADPEIPADEPAPGWCFPSEECAPGVADLVCGEESFCGSRAPVTFCFPAGTAMAGDDCDPNSPEESLHCANNLVCEFGKCLVGCGEDDACANEGEQCLDYTEELDGLDYRVCYASCDAFDQMGCAEAETCVLLTSIESGPIGSCEESESVNAGEGVAGDECTPRMNTYWGDCTTAHLCSGEEGDEECLAFCHVNDTSSCAGNSVCQYLGVQGEGQAARAVPIFGEGLPGLGLCLGSCNPLAPEAETGCAEGEKCLLSSFGLRGDQEAASGLCEPAGENLVDSGEECELDEETFEHNCRSGHLCTPVVQNGPNICVQLCDSEAEEPGCNPWPDGDEEVETNCIGDLFLLSARVGACLNR